jgi:hypothetical protein
MADRPFLFELYRLNLVDDESPVFDFMGRNISTDEDILRVLERVSNSQFDMEQNSGRTIYRWSAREYTEIELGGDDNPSMLCTLTLGRSTLQQHGRTVTEQSFENALTTLSPPSADVIHLFFYMQRHLVVVEYNSLIMESQSWRNCLHTMLARAAQSLELRPGIRLEPIPREEEIIQAFRSFQRLTRLRVRLRLPNPEMDRRTERLRREMVASAIREYTQDMKNPAGLSQSEDGLPFATAAMAQAGYKDGEVIMTGVRDGRRVTTRTGKRAIRGRIDGIDGFREYIRGIAVTAKTAEGRHMIHTILEEVDRIAEIPTPPEIKEFEK